MRSLVEHTPSGLMLDFVEPDFGGSDQAAIIKAWRDGWRPEPGDLICYFHRCHERPWLYFKTSQGGRQMIAAHWPGTGLAGSHEIHGPSLEHDHITEYVCRAGGEVGWSSDREVSLPTRIRSDAVIYGSVVKMGVEAQRSSLTATEAKKRTTKARRAGIEPVWFSDSRSNPSWLWKVPGVRMNPDTSWATLPRQRTVTVVSGVRGIALRRCQDMRNGQCSQRRYGCNAIHADHEPRPVLVDDLAAMVPGGVLVPVLYRRLGGGDDVLIVSQADKERYESVIEASADVPLRLRQPQRPQPTDRLDCKADAGAYVQSPRCPVHGNFLIELVPGRLYCRFCFASDPSGTR